MLDSFSRLMESVRISRESGLRLHKEQQRMKYCQGVVEEARGLIVHSIKKFQRAVDNKADVTGWTPERVLANNAAFRGLCQRLKDQEIWDRLTKGEKRFIVRAIGYAKHIPETKK